MVSLLKLNSRTLRLVLISLIIFSTNTTYAIDTADIDAEGDIENSESERGSSVVEQEVHQKDKHKQKHSNKVDHQVDHNQKVKHSNHHHEHQKHEQGHKTKSHSHEKGQHNHHNQVLRDHHKAANTYAKKLKQQHEQKHQIQNQNQQSKQKKQRRFIRREESQSEDPINYDSEDAPDDLSVLEEPERSNEGDGDGAGGAGSGDTPAKEGAGASGGGGETPATSKDGKEEGEVPSEEASKEDHNWMEVFTSPLFLVAFCLIIVAGGAALWWFYLRPQNPYADGAAMPAYGSFGAPLNEDDNVGSGSKAVGNSIKGVNGSKGPGAQKARAKGKN